MQSYTSGEDRKVGFGLGTFGKMEGGFGLAFNSVLPVARLRLPSNDKSFCFPLPRARINAELKELRVCTNRTCRRQGSMQILETLSSLAPPEVAVKSCGCLGRCGAGPNLVALPDGVVVGHCGTPARASEILMVLCGIKSDHDAAKNLEALALRKRAEAEFEKANFSEADGFLSQAIELKPFGGIHVLYKDRCLARLTMGNFSAALEDVREALELAPNYTEAYICQGDVFLAMDQYDAAEKSYSTCLQIDPSICRSKSFKTRIGRLQEKQTAANKP
ncbi:hypothetical protein CICLE_v10021617mg [Citrus x clementina]|uniref:Uncharacterized protein n=2 Tax=Citrus clementina TaxID=85681 RepID=V4TML8_CITCL|nr:hypothetical protein CICLE_v10021617mg [Citrus x clementina]ESR54636.1 hypothetical protein CICLE_v10021617mg [Citrus x clementina]ESR54637.1 hypothetical protein CICLE_v10021617mg [Citrus x clementina]